MPNNFYFLTILSFQNIRLATSRVLRSLDDYLAIHPAPIPTEPPTGSLGHTGSTGTHQDIVSRTNPDPSGNMNLYGSTAIWDWHSTIIMVLFAAIGYHLWSFRAFYTTLYRFLRTAFRNRDFDIGMRVEMVLTSSYAEQREQLDLTVRDTLPEPLSVDTTLSDEIVVVDDHYHDCQ